MADFEGANTAIDGWDYDPSIWQVVTEGGDNLLVGKGSLQQPLVILGLEHPEWLDSTASDIVINFSINLDPQSGGARLVFRCANSGGCPGGYEVLEIFPGLLSLKRNAPTPNLFDRQSERILRTASAAVEANKWQDITLWVEGSRIFVYLNRQLALSVEDLILPQLGAGAIILQTNSQTRAVRWDNFIFQRAETASDHFEASGIPSAWMTTDRINTFIGQEGSGNQYLQMQGVDTVTPNLLPIRDLTLSCRVWIDQGGYKLVIRNNAGGSLTMDMVGGNMMISQLDGAGGVVNHYQVNNFFNRNRWEDVNISFIGDRLTIYRDGVSRFEETIPDSPAAGGIYFETGRGDVLRLDDCLITETAATSNAGARFAIALQTEVLAREFRELRSDLTEDFADQFRTDVWWEDGVNAPGQYLTDPASSDHQKFLRMIHQNRSTWRLFKDTPGVAMFGAGADRRNFNDSTDLYVTVDVRFPEGAGTAWLGIRSTPTITGAGLNGYRLEITRAADGTYTAVVRYDASGQQSVYFDGAVPGIDPSTPPEWINLTAITYHDKLAFFANGQFILSLENAEALGGTLALGVEDGTTADFDTLIIRDTTPHDQ